MSGLGWPGPSVAIKIGMCGLVPGHTEPETGHMKPSLSNLLDQAPFLGPLSHCKVTSFSFAHSCQPSVILMPKVVTLWEKQKPSPLTLVSYTSAKIFIFWNGLTI